MVRLKAVAVHYENHFFHSFNSKMVRLKVLTYYPNGEVFKMFQFQNGSIKSLGNVNKAAADEGFNSKMVRLKV